MHMKFAAHACLLGGILLTAAATNANADEWNKKTIITTSRSIEVPGAILPAGKYVFKLLDSPSNRHIVQVFNEREDHVFATILAIPKQRMEPANDTILTFYEMPGGGPEPVRAWFYPGNTIGQEFAYPKRRAGQISQVTRIDVPIAPDSVTSMTATSTDTNENSADRIAVPVETAEAVPVITPPDANTSASTSTTASTSMTDRDEQTTPPASREPAMPHTAGNTASLALIGLGCFGIAASLRMAASAAGNRS